MRYVKQYIVGRGSFGDVFRGWGVGTEHLVSSALGTGWIDVGVICGQRVSLGLKGGVVVGNVGWILRLGRKWPSRSLSSIMCKLAHDAVLSIIRH